MSQTNSNVTEPSPAQVSRRQAIQWVMAAAAASAMPATVFAKVAKEQAPLPAKGYGLDVNLVKVYKPGDFWPLTFTPAQKKTATALADLILPKDQYGPAASQLGVQNYIDEWVSAPYPQQQNDRPVILEGLAWLDEESGRRFGATFAAISDQQKHSICDDICFTETAKPQHKRGAEFFSRFRSVAAAAYYATPEGWNAIGYVGNVILEHFDGPPPEVLAKLGVTQTVK